MKFMSEQNPYTDEKLQELFFNDELSYEERQRLKWYLPTINYNRVKFYDEECGEPKFNVGDVMIDGKGYHYLIVEG